MKKNIKSLIVALLLLPCLLLLSACGGDSEDGGDSLEYTSDTFRSKTETINAVTNFSIKIALKTYNADGNVETTINLIEKKCAEGYYLELEGVGYCFDQQNSSVYMLDTTNKTKVLMTTEFNYEQSSPVIANLFEYLSNVDGLIDKGTATVAGISCKKYLLKISTMECYFYVDKTTDICLKKEVFVSNKLYSSIEVTEYAIGNTTFASFGLDDYQLVLTTKKEDVISKLNAVYNKSLSEKKYSLQYTEESSTSSTVSSTTYVDIDNKHAYSIDTKEAELFEGYAILPNTEFFEMQPSGEKSFEYLLYYSYFDTFKSIKEYSLTFNRTAYWELDNMENANFYLNLTTKVIELSFDHNYNGIVSTYEINVNFDDENRITYLYFAESYTENDEDEYYNFNIVVDYDITEIPRISES